MTEMIRFFCVTVAGVVIDIALAYGLAAGLGVPLWLAASIGFVVAATFNYVAHQLWSFRTGPRALSAARAARYGGAALVVLAVRVMVVAGLDRLLGGDPALAILIGGAGVSFFVNFGLSKFVVFAERAPEAT